MVAEALKNVVRVPFGNTSAVFSMNGIDTTPAVIALGLSLDNGTEFHAYESVERLHRVKFYFATPYHSWERGTNENTNGLIRQYLPKGMCLRHIEQAECDRIAGELNDRPRHRLGFKTPSEAFARS